jgi:LL-diaminopimelate aminotransferase
MRRNGADIINLGIGSPDLPPSPSVIGKLSASAALGGSHGYQSYNGIPALREAFAGWYARYFGVSLSPETEILPLAGSKEGIMHISMAFLDEGDEVLVPDPGYPTYASAARLAGGKVRTYPLEERNGWQPDLKQLEKTSLKKVKLMWVNYPHMPTGARGSRQLFESLIAFARRHRILLVNDNPYNFILNHEPLSLLSVEGSREVALELNSLSKSHNMAGWRIGMVAGDAEYLRAIVKVKSNMDSGMFLPMQLAAAEALQAPDSWYQSLNRVYEHRRELAAGILKRLECTFEVSQSGLFLWGRIPETYASGEELTETLLQQCHIFLTPGMVFGPAGEKYIRISLCADEELLRKALSRLSEFRSGILRKAAS